MRVCMFIYIVRQNYEVKRWLQANQNALFPTKAEIFLFFLRIVDKIKPDYFFFFFNLVKTLHPTTSSASAP